MNVLTPIFVHMGHVKTVLEASNASAVLDGLDLSVTMTSTNVLTKVFVNMGLV